MKLILSQLMLLAGLMVTQQVSAQNPGVIWEREISGEIDYVIGEVKYTSDDGLIIVGTAQISEDNKDIFLARFSDGGDLLWLQYYGGPDDDIGNSVAEVNGGGFIIAGNTNSYGNGNEDLIICRTEDDGDLSWQETYGTGGNEGGTRIREVIDGFIVSGFQGGNNGAELILVKFDLYGEKIWAENYSQIGEFGLKTGTSVEPDGNNYILTGTFESPNTKIDSRIIKVDSSGNVIWHYLVEGDGDDFIYDVKPTGNGYLVCGKSTIGENDTVNSRLVKLNSDGELIWDKEYKLRVNSSLNQIVLLENGSFACVGTLSDSADKMFIALFTSWGDTLSLEEMTFRGPAKGKSICTSADQRSLFVSSDFTDPESMLLSGIVVAYEFPCPVWYPRALQINNMWCPGGTQCYPSLTKILTDATGQSADSLIDYLQFNKINNLLLGDLNVVLFEDELVNRNANVNGEDLRDSLASLIARIRDLPDITDITVILRDMDDEDIADTTNNMEMIRLTSAFNKNYGFNSRINELSLDYEFWRDRYGDPSGTNSADYPYIQQGWQHYREIANRMKLIKADTSNRISVISTILGRMDRNIDGNTATGLDGEDENLIVDFADSTFDRVFLFFYIPDETNILLSREPTRFMTGWNSSLAQLAERIYWFGANSTQSHIWPMYSAEDSLSPSDDNIYLGRWLQGTGTWTIQHYLTECQNIFRTQIQDYKITTLNIFPSWAQSISISGDAFFKYGLNDLDALRNQDRFPNFYARPACYQYRLRNYQSIPGYESTFKKTNNNKILLISNEQTFEEWKKTIRTEKKYLINCQGVQVGKVNETTFSKISSGFYFATSPMNQQIIVIIK